MSERPHFKEVRADFAWDGSTRDIYVLNTDATDWGRLGSTLGTSGFAATYLVYGQPAPLPVNLASYITDPHRSVSMLVVKVTGDLSLSCHFFTPDQIEFDFDPRSVRAKSDWDRLLDFIARVGHGLGKSVLITPENLPSSPIITYEPRTESWTYHPAPSD